MKTSAKDIKKNNVNKHEIYKNIAFSDVVNYFNQPYLS